MVNSFSKTNALCTVLTLYLNNTYCIFAIILTMPYPNMLVGVVAGKAMIDGGYRHKQDSTYKDLSINNHDYLLAK